MDLWPEGRIRLIAVDHNGPNAEPDQAPKPYTQHWAFKCDVECCVDKGRHDVASDKQEKPSPLRLAPVNGSQQRASQHAKPRGKKGPPKDYARYPGPCESRGYG